MSYSSLYNASGEMNASSTQELLTQMSKIASIIERGAPSNVALSGRPEVSSDRRDQLFEKALFSAEGKIALAQSMANPIR